MVEMEACEFVSFELTKMILYVTYFFGDVWLDKIQLDSDVDFLHEN